MEEWKEVKGYEGYYQVSDLGRVRRGGRVLKNQIMGRGYEYVPLSVDGVRKNGTIHVLVASAFLNHKRDSGLVVDHIDNNPRNNKLSNLQLLTHRENITKESRGNSKFSGVDFNKGKWRARLMINGKTFYLGRFNCEIDARNAYQDKLKQIQ